MDIGNWVRRRGTKWHLVESVVSGDAVTRCGKRMDQWTASGGGLQVSKVMPLTRMIGQPQLCKAGCDRGQGAVLPNVPEDNGSTQPELVP